MAHPLAHPLALALAERLAATPLGSGVLLLGAGSGRNVPPLRAAALDVTILEEDASRARATADRFAGDSRVMVVCAPYVEAVATARRFAAALSTHALLHGRPAHVLAAVHAIRDVLIPGGLLFATFGSTTDPRYGQGHRIERDTYAAQSGKEAGVAHAFFDEAGVRALVAGFVIESLVQSSGTEAGRWAHTADEAASLVHWFVRAHVTQTATRLGA